MENSDGDGERRSGSSYGCLGSGVSIKACQHDASFLFLHPFLGGGLISVASKIFSLLSHFMVPTNIIGCCILRCFCCSLHSDVVQLRITFQRILSGHLIR